MANIYLPQLLSVGGRLSWCFVCLVKLVFMSCFLFHIIGSKSFRSKVMRR